MHWQIITGEYPPQRGGVSDYTRLVAVGLASSGDKVDVWAPQCSGLELDAAGVRVHRLPGHFGPRALSALSKGISLSKGIDSRDSRVLLQYVPHAFGWKAMNFPLCVWFRLLPRDSAWVMFHEVAFPLGLRQPLRRNAMALVQRLMAAVVVRAAGRIFVSTPAWETLLRPLVLRKTTFKWLPVFSNVPKIDDPDGVRCVRRRFVAGEGLLAGHFGTYAKNIGEILAVSIGALLAMREEVSMLLIGSGSDEFRDRLLAASPHLRLRVHATGHLGAEDVSRAVAACDVMLQPYPDGVDSRRTSALVGLSHGIPTVTTRGRRTEALWQESGAAALVAEDAGCALAQAVAKLLDDAVERTRLGAAGASLYRERFDLSRTISALRGDA